MSDEFDPPPPELTALHGRLLPTRRPSVEGPSAIRARLDAAVRARTRVTPDGLPPPPPRLPRGVALGAFVFLLGALVGALLVALWPRPPVIVRVVAAPHAPATLPTLAPAAPTSTTAPPAPTTPPLVASVTPPTRSASRRADAGRESAEGADSWRAREQLDVIEDALQQRRPDVALGILARHEREFPRLGATLSQLREALTIRALHDTGRREEAATRARRFVAAHPQSPYRATVESLAGGGS